MDVPGQKLRDTRKKLGYTLKEVSDRTGVSIVMISDLEKGRRTPIKSEAVKALCTLYKLNYYVMQSAYIDLRIEYLQDLNRKIRNTIKTMRKQRMGNNVTIS